MGSGTIDNPGGVPSFFRYFVFTAPGSTFAASYMGLYANSPTNGTVDVSGYASIKLKLWGPAEMYKEQISIRSRDRSRRAEGRGLRHDRLGGNRDLEDLHGESEDWCGILVQALAGRLDGERCLRHRHERDRRGLGTRPPRESGGERAGHQLQLHECQWRRAGFLLNGREPRSGGVHQQLARALLHALQGPPSGRPFFGAVPGLRRGRWRSNAAAVRSRSASRRCAAQTSAAARCDS